MKKQTISNLIATILVYIFLILAILKVGNLEIFLKIYVFIMLVWQIYKNWNIKGKDNHNSYEYLWKNNKVVFICHVLLFLSLFIGLLIY